MLTVAASWIVDQHSAVAAASRPAVVSSGNVWSRFARYPRYRSYSHPARICLVRAEYARGCAAMLPLGPQPRQTFRAGQWFVQSSEPWDCDR